MLALISPAKKLDIDSKWDEKHYTQPDFLEQTEILSKILKKYSQVDLKNLMTLSDTLAALNYQRYQDYHPPFTSENTRPACFMFRGDTYVGLDADHLSADDLIYAQDHLRILSGFYGLLRPLDLMQPYRLEMGTKLATERGRDLYDFWGSLLTKSCNDLVKNHKDQTVISLASQEYIKAVQPQGMIGNFITCHFKEVKKGIPKTIGLFAKRARGMMARYMIKNRIESPDGLKDFQEDQYRFMPKASDNQNYVFYAKRGA